MSLRIDTRALMGLLVDLLATASDDYEETPELCGVLVHTTRGYWGAEPGQVDLLAGISSNRFVMGHAWHWVNGQLGDRPMWWSRDDIAALLGTLKPLVRKASKDHAVRLSLTDRVRGDTLGDSDSAGFVVVEEDLLELFSGGFSCSFPARGPGDFPGQSVYRLLASRPSGTYTDPDVAAEVSAVRRTDYSATQLGPFLAVAKRRGGAPVQTYRAHQNQMVQVQIGDEGYLGALMPLRFDYGADGDSPSAEVQPPEWPATPGDDTEPDAEGVLVPSNRALPSETEPGDDPDQTSTDDLDPNEARSVGYPAAQLDEALAQLDPAPAQSGADS